MFKGDNQFHPDYCVPPGWILEEYLDTRGWNQSEFARRCGRTPKMISEILSGKAPILPETALLFEKIFEVSAETWLTLESNYQLFQAKEKIASEQNLLSDWAKQFPLNDLVKGGWIPKTDDVSSLVTALFTFFSVGNKEGFEQRYQNLPVVLKHTEKYKSSWPSIVSYIRIGEILSDKVETKPFHAGKFKETLNELRSLTREPVKIFEPKMREFCAQCGVVLLFVKPLKKVRMRGAAKWLSSDKAMIMMSLRDKSNDIFWFTFFHEAAHLLLHSKKDFFIDFESHDTQSTIDFEADQFASDFLIPKEAWKVFEILEHFDGETIIRFALQQGIHPAIVLGRLQKTGKIGWATLLNNLKDRYEFKESNQNP